MIGGRKRDVVLSGVRKGNLDFFMLELIELILGIAVRKKPGKKCRIMLHNASFTFPFYFQQSSCVFTLMASFQPH